MTDSNRHRILIVDDEVNIVNSLKRLLRNEGYRIELCQSGEEALKILDDTSEPFSLIISDQRMPGMNGSDFLQKATELAPDAVRFLLTGYSDLQAVVDAVNKGKIQRYLTKPWNDEVLLIHVRQAIQEVELRRENERLTRLTRSQNKQLYELGLSLDKKVKERTQELKEKAAAIELMNQKLEKSFLGAIRFLLSLIEATDHVMGAYLRQVGMLSKIVARRLGTSAEEVNKIELAGLLHDIGLYGLPEKFLYPSENDLSGMELRRYRQHPEFAAISMETIDKLADVSEIVLHHHERYDGKGFPDGLKKDEIPIGSRIISAVSDYCGIIHYWPKNMKLIQRKLKDDCGVLLDVLSVKDLNDMLETAAAKSLNEGVHNKYDSVVVAALLDIIKDHTNREKRNTARMLPLTALRPGMVIPQDLFLFDGRMLLAKSTVLDEAAVKAVQKLGKLNMLPDTITVAYPEKIYGQEGVF